MPQLAERIQREWKMGRGASTGRFIRVEYANKHPDTSVVEKAQRKKTDAVLNYVRTVRGLGRTKVSSGDVADALGLPERDVRRIMLSMQREGIRAR